MEEGTETQKQAPEAQENSVNNALDGLSAFLSPEEINELKKESPAQESTAQESTDAGDDNKGEGEKTPEQLAEEAKANEEGSEEGADGDQEKTPEELEAEAKALEEAAARKEVKSILGLKKQGAKGNNEVAIEKPEEILGVLNKKFGLAMKEPKELSKFIEVSQGWRSKAEKAEALEAKNTEYQEFLSGLPEDLFDSLLKYEKGEDYRSVLASSSKIDYNTPLDKQDVKALVDFYYPEKFTKEDFEDESPSEILQVVIDASKDKFKIEKQVHDQERVRITQKAAEDLKIQTAAVQNSVSRLNQAFPEMEKDDFTKVKSTIEGGPQQVLSVFYNKDGTIKPEAGELLAMAIYGKEEINRMMNITETRTETKINEDLLSRGADTKKPVKSTGTPEKISEKGKEKLAELERIAKRSNNTF